MKAAPFRYHQAASVDDAVAALDDPDAAVLAGGQSLIPMMAMRLARPEVLVDISRVEELTRLRADDGWLEVGAAVTQRRLERSTDSRRVPLLAAALPWIGHREIRNRGTVGGSIVHADPSAELPCVAATLDAELVLRGSQHGERVVTARTFFTGAFQTIKEPGDLLTAVRFPMAAAGEGFAFDEVARRHGDFALCGVAARVRSEGRDVVDATIGLLGVADIPLVVDATPALRDAAGAEDGFGEAATALVANLRPGGDIHASPDYRRRLARVLVARCLRRATDTSGGVAA